MAIRFLVCVVFWLAVFPPASSAQQRFPFVIPGYDAAPSATDFSHLSHKPAGKHGFVRVVDGHFATEAGRLRIWGVNLSFGANFPTHDEADKVAAHLAKIGVNGVRIHHHETQYSPKGMFQEDGSWDPRQIDRLDYFLAQLHRHGIYANLNLHVGRQVSRRLGLPSLGSEHYLTYDKHALHFQPEIQQAFWKYCREYLQHENPYRKLRRADDPGIAMLEICNENKFSDAGPNALLAARAPYRASLIREWNDWLGNRYENTAALRKAWATDDDSKPRVLADSGKWAMPGRGDWTLNDNNGRTPIKLSVNQQDGQRRVRFEPQVRAAQGWHQQWASGNFTLEKGKTYLLRFDVRADKAHKVGLHVATSQDGTWQALGLSRSLDVGPNWSNFAARFSPPVTVRDGAKVSFDIGGDETPLELHERQLAAFRDKVHRPIEVVKVAPTKYDWQDLKHWPPLVELRLIPRSNLLQEKSPLPLNQGMRGWFWTGHYVWTDELEPVRLLYSNRTAKRENFEWTLNQAHLVFEATEPGILRTHVDSQTPNFKQFLRQTGDVTTATPALFDWSLRSGRNDLQIVPQNQSGRIGIATTVELSFLQQ